MGPGLLGALSGNDAGGIATYSSAGASYGYATLWMLPVMALAALSGNDAGGIATYSSAGASYGYATLWMLPVMSLLLIVVQETAAR